MSEIPNDDKVHCFACYRLIRPGETYHLTFEGIVHCKGCAFSEGVTRVREDLSVEAERGR